MGNDCTVSYLLFRLFKLYYEIDESNLKVKMYSKND